MTDNATSAESATTDREIVDRALSGDADAFGEIVRRWERTIYHLAYSILGLEDEAWDATQETFICAFRGLREYRGDAKLSSWLHRIAVNQCISRKRRTKSRGEEPLEDNLPDCTGMLALSGRFSPAYQAEAGERKGAVRRAINALPSDLRQIILMKEFEELTFQQIADALDLPLSTVKSRLYTALKQLRMRLAVHAL